MKSEGENSYEKVEKNLGNLNVASETIERVFE